MLLSRPQRGLLYVLLVICFSCSFFYLESIWQRQAKRAGEPRAMETVGSNPDVLETNSSKTLPYIPPRIWQIYTPFNTTTIPKDLTSSWILGSPSYTYSILDEEGCRSVMPLIVERGGLFADAMDLFDKAPRWMLRGDLSRYAMLAIKGGVYADADTALIKPLADWVPNEYKHRTRLIVGLEADLDGPWDGIFYPVQFATWCIAGEQGHPIFWNMVEHILGKLRSWPPGVDFLDSDILKVTGPASWTEAVFSYLSDVSGTNVTGANVTGMREPRLFGDALVLPIDGFGTGQPHSGSSQENSKDTMVRHYFHGSWRSGQ